MDKIPPRTPLADRLFGVRWYRVSRKIKDGPPWHRLGVRTVTYSDGMVRTHPSAISRHMMCAAPADGPGPLSVLEVKRFRGVPIQRACGACVAELGRVPYTRRFNVGLKSIKVTTDAL